MSFSSRRTWWRTGILRAMLPCLAIALSCAPAFADPCGLVPPIYVTDNTSLVRVGDEQTYLFFKDGLETFVIRPGFQGKVEDFGMLISFPTPPALRKVAEDIFPQIANAVDPPEVVVDLRWDRLARAGAFRSFNANGDKQSGDSSL